MATSKPPSPSTSHSSRDSATFEPNSSTQTTPAATDTTSTPSNLFPTNTASIPSTLIASSSPTPNTLSASSSHAGTIAGSVIGGIIFLVLLALGALLYLRARRRERTPPSSEFLNSIRAGSAPVLRLDSGAEFTPGLSEKVAGGTHYPPSPPPPTYYPSPPTDEMTIDPLSGRPSVEEPLRYASRRGSSPFVAQHHPSMSIGSRRELWGGDIEMTAGDLSPVRRSPVNTDSVLQFAPRFSLDGFDRSPSPSLPSHSPPPLHPLRRQPKSGGT